MNTLRTLIKQKNDIKTRLRELPLDKLEKLGEIHAELKSVEWGIVFEEERTIFKSMSICRANLVPLKSKQ